MTIMKNTVFWTCTLLVSSAFWPSAVLAQQHNYDNDRTAKHIARVGKFDSWTVRLIEESAIIGGNTAVLYEPVMHSDTLQGRVAYTNPPDCHWRTSNAYADVLGVVKASASVFPERRDSGYCARLEVRMEEVKVPDADNMEVICQGAMYLGSIMEPVGDPVHARKKVLFGVPYSGRPQALKVDYKAVVGNEAIRATGIGHKKELDVPDYAEMVLILQRRWEDSHGHIYAERVGTAYERIDTSVTEWRNGQILPLKYGDITSDSSYCKAVGLMEEKGDCYAINNRGKSVPVIETGWADEDTKPNTLIIRFSASCGEPFCGGSGNTLWIDNVELVF